MTRSELATYIDHSQLKAAASQSDIDQLCDEAVEHGFATVCVNPVWVTYCAKRLADASVGIATTIGFPLGATTAFIKVEETREAIRNGATEIDMVINIGALKSGYSGFVADEIHAVVEAADAAPVKVILECCYLTDTEKRMACALAKNAGAAYVKTSTGFGTHGATLEDVRLMKQEVGETLNIKAAGGIRSYEDAVAFIEAGATRLGTSNGVEIIKCPL